MDDLLSRSVLLVDDEPGLLEVITKGLALLHPEYEVYTARSVSEALAQLAARFIDLVVTDLRMPGLDGFELLAYLSRSSRRIPVIVMSGHLTPESRQRVASLGGLWCFEKPIYLRDLADAMVAIFASGPRSVVHGVSVAGFLQLLEIEKKTCTLTIRQGERIGRLFLSRGRLVDAEFGPLGGVEAAQNLVGLTDAELEVAHVLASRQRTIDQSVGTLLLDAFRVTDEAQRGSDHGGHQPATRPPGLDPAAVHAELEALVALRGFVAAAVYTTRSGLLAKQGDPTAVDAELCARVNATTGGLERLLSERDWGVIEEADFVTSGGWVVALRTSATEGLALIATFSNPGNLGLLHLRLRETMSNLKRLPTSS